MIERVAFGGWPNCVRLANDQVELIITTDVGPRIIRFGTPGGPNLFKVFPEQSGLTGGEEWRSYGGHRLWHAPESMPRTYFGDNGPVAVEEQAGFVRLVQSVETTTGIQKEMDVSLSPDSSSVQVVHRMRNTNLWPVQLSVWALSVMDIGGTAVFPLPPRAKHSEDFSANSRLVLWAYTDLSDPRFTLGRQYILMRQDPARTSEQKLGTGLHSGWAAYILGKQMFAKQTVFQAGAKYPDLGCSLEIFINGEILELETLGPLVNLSPGGEAEHTERWLLVDRVDEPRNDQDVEQKILPLLRFPG